MCACRRLSISEQDGQAAGSVHSALDQQGMRQLEKLRVMLEVLGGGLHGVDHVPG
jgi:hypothetical protein